MLIDEIFRDSLGGQIMSRVITDNESDALETMPVLIPKAIENGTVVKENLASAPLIAQIDPRKLTKEGDIVVKLSTPYEACLITKEYEGLIVPSFCAILREHDKRFSPYYLIAYMNSKFFRKQVQVFISGAAVGILSIGQIRKIDIPLKSIELQKTIAEQYQSIVNNNVLIKKLMQLQDEKLDTLINMED